MFLLLWYSAVPVDEVLSAYACRGGVLSREIQELAMHFILMCNDEASIATNNSVKYGKGQRVAITFFLEVCGGYIIRHV